MKALFLISGLGADERVFDFLDLSGYELIHIRWIKPLLNETIEQYAKRLAEQITIQNPIIIGVSFGGMIAVEIGKQIAAEKIILISSVQIRSEIPWYFRLMGSMGLHRLMPVSGGSPPAFLINYFFSVKEKSEKDLLKDIVEKTDPDFQQWAVDKILNWTNHTQLSNVITIHGTRDRIFSRHTATHLLQNGGHFMIVNKAAEISALLKQIL